MKLLHKRQFVYLNLNSKRSSTRQSLLHYTYLFFKEAIFECLLSRISASPSKDGCIFLQDGQLSNWDYSQNQFGGQIEILWGQEKNSFIGLIHSSSFTVWLKYKWEEPLHIEITRETGNLSLKTATKVYATTHSRLTSYH